MRNLAMLVLLLFVLVAASQGQHTMVFPPYVFAQSVLDTTKVDQPLLMLFFQAIDKSELKIFVFNYKTGMYMGEVLVLPNGQRQFYPFNYKEMNDEKDKKKKVKGSKTFIG